MYDVTHMLSLGRVRRAVHPLFLRYWLHKRSSISVKTSVEGFDLDVFPMVFHPRFLLGAAQSTADRAFFGGLNFDVIREFATDARAHLRTGGSIYMILSADIDITGIEQIFRDQSFKTSRVLSARWLLGET